MKQWLLLSASVLAFQLSAAHAQMAVGQSDTGARPGNDIGTRNSLPLSPNASNIAPGDTNSVIAPTPPEPNVPANATVGDYLQNARVSLVAGQTGTADEAMERAETQLLTRSIPKSDSIPVSRNPMVDQIEQARMALGNKHPQEALEMIDQILRSGSPQLMN